MSLLPSLPKTENKIITFFIAEETRSSALLVVAAAGALLLANSAVSNAYFDALNATFSVGPLTLDIQHWINDFLMALFFLVVGLEIKRELIDGELQGWRRASFPVIAAIGGMVVPALIFAVLNPSPPENSGWAIPMATDIAIAVGVLGLLGKRIPRSIRIFLLSLAIVDDIGSILVIALFYSQPSNTLALILAVVALLAMAVVRTKKWWPLAFGVLGVMVVYLLVLAGVSGTIGGVAIAALMPLAASSKSARIQTAEQIEDWLLPIVSFVIVPLFVFANAGIVFNDISLSAAGELSVFLGVLVGLFIGKPLGVYAACRIGVWLGITHKPAAISWRQLNGVGFLAGIGFTIAILISGLAYPANENLQNVAILGIFCASVISAFAGVILLKKQTTPH